VEAVAAAGFVVVAAVLPLVLSSSRSFDPLLALALTLTYALASRVRLYLGAGYAMPNQFALVPMFYLLPVSSLPALTACALVALTGLDCALGRTHPERLLSALADDWYVVGGVLVFAFALEPMPSLSSLWVLAVALAAQCATDLTAATAREWFGRRIPPSEQMRVILSVYRVDLSLTPVGLAVAIAAEHHAYAFLLGVPLLALLAALALDRSKRIEEAVARGEELAEQHARLDRTIRRIGESFASKLDRIALVNLVLRTAGEALEADHGRATTSSGVLEWAADGEGSEAPASLEAAETAARHDGRLQTIQTDGYAAIAMPVTGEELAGIDVDVLSVGRRGRRFTPQEQALFGYLAQQAAVAVENVALHDQLQRQATVDELTGLANHRRFREALENEFKRMRRSHRPLALVLFDIDDFKAINDTHGHPHGDKVLRAVSAVLHDACRSTDEPARYGGEELALVLPETDLEGGFTIAEAIRRGVEALEVPLADGTPVRVTISAGVSALDAATRDPEDLVQASDIALYEAKRAGKNRTVRNVSTPA
jgi:diguanylate cyclase (GGDEF)-like protein